MGEHGRDSGPTVAIASDPPSATEREPARRRYGPDPSDRRALGRYVIVEEAGAGGMGVVLRAYDPKLRREVALKRLRAAEADERPIEGAARLMREARALARLNHPNVLSVYDAEEIDGRIYVVMEYVEGTTLRGWNDAQPRHWREILAMFLQAAHGLAAAHEAGLVHRDFKPGNVLVGRDGRARVLDFGIARAETDDVAVVPSSSGEDDAPTVSADDRLTAAGVVLGTPPYMSPEQHRGLPADARADQYAWCVALWEALFGQLPFVGDAATLVAAKRSGPPPVPSTPPVPRWLTRVIVRGLSPTPERRFGSMSALLAEMERGRGRARTRIVALVGAVAMLGIAGTLAWRRADGAARIAACEEAGADITTTWNDETRARVRAAILATGVSYAESTAERALPWLDAYALEWQRAHTDACLDTRVHGAWDADLLDRALWCLDERRMAFAALVEKLEAADQQVVQTAVSASSQQASVEQCRDADMLRRLPSPPTDRRDDVRAVRIELARAGALSVAGEYREALALAEQTQLSARELGWPPLVGAAAYAVGMSLDRLGRYPEAERALVDAYLVAARSNDAALAAEAAAQLTYVVGFHGGRTDDAMLWAQLGEVEEGRLGDVDGLRTATRLSNTGVVRRDAGSYEEARALMERALAIRERVFGPDNPQVAVNLLNLGGVLLDSGHAAEAQALQERALALQKETLGADHPEVARSLAMLANVHLSRGHHDEARKLYEQSLEVQRSVLGPDHPHVARILSNLGSLEFYTGHYQEAHVLFRSAATIFERALGAEHPDVATALFNLGAAELEVGDASEAGDLFERALAIRRKALPPDHPDVAQSLANLASARLTTGDRAEARELYESALAIQEKLFTGNHDDIATSVAGLGRVALAEERWQDACRDLERALAMMEALDEEPTARARVRFALARALWGAGDERARALELARAAMKEFESGGDVFREQVVEVERWIDHRK